MKKHRETAENCCLESVTASMEDTRMKMFQISDKIDNVSRIGIGCMRITGLSDEKEVRSLIEGALECGINFFDHADIYAGG